MKRVERVGREYYADIYQMICQQDFPDTPTSLDQAAIFFDRAVILGVVKESMLIAAILLFPSDTRTYCIDGVCKLQYQGKWASRTVVRSILNYIFNTLMCDVLWTESNRLVAQNMTRKLGFQKICRTSNGVLSVLTPAFSKFTHTYKENT